MGKLRHPFWMLKQERLEVKILLMGHGKSHPKPEHAKIQIYEDSFGNRIGSSGSKNDTFRGTREELILL